MKPSLRPDYRGGSIVNLISSIAVAFGAETSPYPPLIALPPSQLSTQHNILLLVIDGLGYQYLTEQGVGSCLQRQVAARITSVFPPTTASAIPTLLTGQAPQQHGFTGWHTYFRELGAQLAILPLRYRGAPGDAGVNPRYLSPPLTLFDQLDVACATVMPDWIARSGFNLAYSGGAEVLAYSDLQGFFDRIEEILTRDSKRRYVYAYWPEFDRLAHHYGVASAEVQQHFRQLDRAFAGFAGRLAGSSTELLLTADHGFIDTDPESTIQVADHPELADCLAMPLSGEPRTAYCHLQPGAEERFERYVQDHLADVVRLVPSRELIAGGWFGLGQPHPRLHERIGQYTMVMRGHHIVRDWLPNERPYQHVGVHGGLSSNEIFVPLVRMAL